MVFGNLWTVRKKYLCHNLTALTLISVFSSLAFLYYGISCLTLSHMKVEFERFGLTATERKITGVTQIIGSVLILIGTFKPWLGFLGALGLSIQMTLGVRQRIKVKDRFHLMLPALFFSILTGYLAYLFYFQLHSR